MKKLVFITTGLATGGAEMMLYKLLQHLDRSRFEPVVISLRDKGQLGTRIESLGIPVHPLGMNPGVPNPFRFWVLVRLLRHIRSDVVQTWMYHADLLGGLAARLAGCRHIVWGIRNSNLDPEMSKRASRMTVKACAVLSSWLPCAIICCSRRAAEVHIAAGYEASKFQVIPDGFDLDRFCPDEAAYISVRQELGLPAITPLVGLIARFDPQKNHLGFIEAAAMIHRVRPDAHFLLAGGGVDSSNTTLVAAIEARGLSPNFHLLGRRDDVPRLMAALDVLASSSYGEAFPNVLGEAMACGVPCVVPAGDMAGLARHIVELLGLPAKERRILGERVRERVDENYDIDLVAGKYMLFYEKGRKNA